uniref:Calponin-homology (CH) domain-containing protein n=1 Tax=Arcella intermedia TaxID=1963864 RepID=A0A6B2KZD0_9EUKA
MRCSDSLEEEFKDGVLLHALLTICSGKQLPKITPKPKVQIQKLENVTKTLKWMQQNGIKLVATGSEDIHYGRTKYVLGMVWTLILYYQLDSSEDEEELGMSMRSALLEWCNNILQPQGITVKNFTDHWKDGRAFSGLVNALQPNTIDLASVVPETSVENLTVAFNKAHELFQFPKMLEAEELVQYQDELSIITYVSYFRAYLSKFAAFAGTTYAEGPGLTEALAFKPAEFTIFACDQNGERVSRGGAFIRLSLKDKRTEKECGRFSVKDHLDGTYSVSYETDKFGTKGNFELHVKVGNSHIKDSPFMPEIIPGEADPSKCVAFGPGVGYAKAGELTEFTVQTKDLKGDNLRKGGTTLMASLKGPGVDIPVAVVDNADGTYSCSYQTENASDLKLHIYAKTDAFGTGPIANSPYSVKVGPGMASAINTIATGEGLTQAVSGLESTFTVISYDKYGNKVSMGGSIIEGEITQQNLSYPLKVVDNEDGTYTVSYTPLKSGAFDLNVKIGDMSIKGAPFTVSVNPGEVTEENTDIQFLPTAIAGVTGATLYTQDEQHNLLLKGGQKVHAVLLPKHSISISAVDNQNGSYDVVFPPEARGKFKVEVKVNGREVPKGTWDVNVAGVAVSEDTKANIAKAFPRSKGIVERLLENATEEERGLILSELLQK